MNIFIHVEYNTLTHAILIIKAVIKPIITITVSLFRFCIYLTMTNITWQHRHTNQYKYIIYIYTYIYVLVLYAYIYKYLYMYVNIEESVYNYVINTDVTWRRGGEGRREAGEGGSIKFHFEPKIWFFHSNFSLISKSRKGTDMTLK